MVQTAEDLRLEGNTAFAQKKWKLAVKKYQESINIDGKSQSSAKVYSNLCAALCKLNKYDDAYEAAEKCTQVDPSWAKGFWRLGVTQELQKDFVSALTSYTRAVEIEPEESTFINAVSYIFLSMCLLLDIEFSIMHHIHILYLYILYISCDNIMFTVCRGIK